MRTGAAIATIAYEANLINPAEAWVRLSHTGARTPGAQTDDEYEVGLETTRPHYGGIRWWFVCPLSDRLARVLYLPRSGTLFASRQELGLAYRSQRHAGMERSHARRRHILAKLGANYRCFGQPPPFKPKWMRWRTYDRLRAELAAAEAVHNEIFVARAGPFLERMRKRRLRPRASRAGRGACRAGRDDAIEQCGAIRPAWQWDYAFEVSCVKDAPGGEAGAFGRELLARRVGIVSIVS